MNAEQSHKLDQTVKHYLIDAIDASSYDKEPQTVQEKINFFAETFTSEYGGQIERIGRQAALASYLSGLPSCIHVAFYNKDILSLAAKWGSLPPNFTDAQAEKILGNYWNFLAAKLCQLMDGYRVPQISLTS